MKNKKQKANFENLFFFTDNDFFNSIRFEYLSPKEPSRGFVFGLFVPELRDDMPIKLKDVHGYDIVNSYAAAKMTTYN